MYKHIEEITLNTWPAVSSMLLEGWVLRFASGYTKRANSVNPLYGPEAQEAGEMKKKISLAERYYEEAGLNPVFKISPYSQPYGLDEELARLGYQVVEPSSVRIRELQDLPDSGMAYHLQLCGELTPQWLEAFSAYTQLSEKNGETLRRMLSSSPLQKGYSLLLKDGVPAACGLGVIQHGYLGLYDIVTAPAYRRQGMAEELILGLLHWARAQGASGSFLQVVQENIGASALYDKLGYKEIYQYWYRVRGKA